MITIHHQAGITGKHIDAVTAKLEFNGWEYVGIDTVDSQTVHCFSNAVSDIHVYTNDGGICGKVEVECIEY